ncbi:Wadjet anti-phage system protein JetD domain-containing protein [Bradyrhizobium sp. SEMIA]|uniref:Wadjet anti-phage system protein JetD domain-containing protein n=1 Tax=Bradyrhizobium sp. SEMIA TaxID=2597515 RepID=UPI00223FF742|nr:Wadjet anti-phage system protein JetD domain-containing protein [Bradyrhizobium sp. SEMIA]
MLGVRIGQPGAAADVVWAHIGLERFSHPVHLKGPVAVEGARGRLVDGSAKPFASIHPEMLSQLAILEPPTAILTIENYASFNRQVREIEDGSLVVYTGGFPTAGIIELLAKVLAVVPAEVPFLHWGDVDAGRGTHLQVPGREPAPRAATTPDDEGIGRKIWSAGIC